MSDKKHEDLMSKINELQRKRLEEKKRAEQEASQVEQPKSKFDFRAVLAESQRLRAEQLQQEAQQTQSVAQTPTPTTQDTLSNQPKQQDPEWEGLSAAERLERLSKRADGEEDVVLTEKDLIDRQNRELLLSAKQKESAEQKLNKRRRRRLLVWISILLAMIFLIAGSLYWVYMTWINPPSDGTTRVSISIDGREYPDGDIYDFVFADGALAPGDTITNEIAIVNGFSSADKGNWEVVYVRFRVDAYYRGKSYNEILKVNVDDQYWYHYDAEVENALINDWDGLPYCREDDGWFYYADQLNPREVTQKMFESIELLGDVIDNSFSGKELSLCITVQSISVKNHQSIVTRFDYGTSEDINIWAGNSQGIYDTEMKTVWSTCPESWLIHLREKYGRS